MESASGSIKSNNQCVGIIFDMNTNLHWLILKKYRGQGYLYNAVRLNNSDNLAYKYRIKYSMLKKKYIEPLADSKNKLLI